MIDQLERARSRFGPGADQETSQLIASAARERFSDAALLARFHEVLLFLRAYPAGPLTAREAEAALQAFSSRIADVADPAPLEEPEISGIAGTAFSAVFTLDAARKLSAAYPTTVDADWEGYDTDRLAACWGRLLPLVEEDSLVEANAPYLDWFRAARGSLSWILDGLKGHPDLYASLELPLRWKLGDAPATRTLSRLDSGPEFFHDGPLIRRSDISIETELAAPDLPVTRLSEADGARIIRQTFEASAIRYRELYGFTYGDPSGVLRAEAGRGVVFYLWGVPPGRRLPLRAYHCAVMVKNTVPVGYVETLTLAGRMDVGFNVYYTFREGESAWLYARLLRLFRQLMPVTCFSVDPYQVGHHNEEAIASGAFWFYRKLGFRPVEPEAVRLLAREEKRIATTPGYRTPPARLRKLAARYMLYDCLDAEPGAWDRFRTRNLGFKTSGRMAEEYGGDLAAMRRSALDGLTHAIGIEPDNAFEHWAMLLASLPDLDSWPEDDKRAIAAILRAKTGADETEYVRLMTRHRRFCQAIQSFGC